MERRGPTEDADLDEVECLEDGSDEGGRELEEVGDLGLESAGDGKGLATGEMLRRGLDGPVVVVVLGSRLLEVLLKLEEVLLVAERLLLLRSRGQVSDRS